VADGFRITEAGDSRITEASDFRITEGLVLAAASLSASGSMSANAAKIKSAATSLSGVGSFAASGSVTRNVSASLSGNGALSAAGLKVAFTSASMSGAGSFSPDGSGIFEGVFFSGIIEEPRETEAGDARITEGSDFRVVEYAEGAGTSSFTALASRLPFGSDSYYNDNGTWKTFVPYVNDDGEWKIPVAIYRHNGSRWLRIR